MFLLCPDRLRMLDRAVRSILDMAVSSARTESRVNAWSWLIAEMGTVSLLVFLATSRANKRYRIHCGECGHRTPWADDIGARDAQQRHFARKHPAAALADDLEITAP